MQKKEIYNFGQNMLIKTGDIDKIILHSTNLSKSQLFLTSNIEDIYIENIFKNLKRLSTGEPIEYVTNKAEFYSLDFYVDSRVLIPRNDTEIMVDKAIEEIILFKNSTLIDIGTGSSCIPISIIKNTEKIKNCYVTDISRKALEVSKININKHNLENKITTIKSNLLAKFLGNNDYELSNNIIITANLPYIKNNDFFNMDKETIMFEPSLALFGGKETGFELYEKLITECILLKKLNNKKNIILFIEIGFDQYKISTNFLKKLGLKFRFFKDNNDIYRCIKINF